jgi:hypothetical protein
MAVTIHEGVKVYGGGTGGGGLTPPLPGENGYVAIAQGGDLTYYGGVTDGWVLTWDAGLGVWVATAAGTGDVSGPGVAVEDHVVARWDGTTGTLLQGGVNAPVYDDTGHLGIRAGNQLRLWNAGGTNYVGVRAAAGTTTWTAVLPTGPGLAGQVLTSDGTGTCYWSTPAGGAADHGSLGGLGDDDHAQYLRTDGARVAAYLNTSGYFSIGAVPATAGAVRLSNNTGIYARNGTNSANVPLVRLNSSDIMTVGDEAAVLSMLFGVLSAYGWRIAGTQRMDLSEEELGLNFSAMAAPSLPGLTGAVYFFKWTETLCVAHNEGRSTVAPIRIA